MTRPRVHSPAHSIPPASGIFLVLRPILHGFEHRPDVGNPERRFLSPPDERGTLRAEAYYSTSSGMLSSLTWSTGLVEVSEEVGDVKVGAAVQYLPSSLISSNSMSVPTSS
jgi:MoeA C-terminal region (domain IV)